MGVQFAGNILVQSNGGPLPISMGGTGQTTASTAIAALLPTQANQAGKSLVTDGTSLSWSSVTASAAGSDTQIQFNDGGSFGGSSAFTINKSTGALTSTGTFTGTGVNVSGAAGSTRSLKLQTAGSDRWILAADSSTESGSLAGSNFAFTRVSDNGATTNQVFTVSRATGVVDFKVAPTVNGSAIGGGGGVTSFNTRTGDVTLSDTDVTGALGFTPGAGTVTSVSVVSANGFEGTVATSTSTPAITLKVNANGILKSGAGGAVSAANAGTDYAPPTATLSTGILKSTTGTGFLSIATASDFPTLNQNTTGNAATATLATLATSATSAITATNIAGGAAGSVPYQTGSGATALLAKGTDGQVLTLASGVPSWATPSAGASVGGSNTQLQYNNSGALGGISGVTYNSSTGFLNANGLEFRTGATLATPDITSASSATSVNILGGNNAGTGRAGSVYVYGGDTAVGSTGEAGYAELNGGTSYGSGAGGNINLYAGGNAGTGSGGNVTIFSGYAMGSAVPGSITIRPGNSDTRTGGLFIEGGSSNTQGGPAYFSGGSGGAGKGGTGILQGGPGIDGGDVYVYGRNTSSSTQGNGGHVKVYTGLGRGTGTNGSFSVTTGYLSGATRFTIDGNGTWYLASDAGTSGQVLTSGGAGNPPTWTTISAGSAAAGSLTGTTLASNVVSSSLTSVGTLTSGSIGSGFTAIPNSALANSSVTVNGTSISLGGSGTVTAAAGTLTGTTLASGVTASSLTSVGTLTSLAVTGTITTGGLEVGTKIMPQNANPGASYTLVLADSGKHIYTTSAGQAYTIPAASSVAYPIGTALTFVNTGSGTCTVAITSDTMYLAGSAGTTGTRTVGAYGVATAIKVAGLSSAGVWIISGTNLS